MSFNDSLVHAALTVAVRYAAIDNFENDELDAYNEIKGGRRIKGFFF